MEFFENNLSNGAEHCTFFNDIINKYPLLTSDEEKELLIKVKNGDLEARNKLILSNIRLVFDICKHFKSKSLSFNDLVQNGYIGLIVAVDKFDLSKGNRFSSYAVHWIKQAVGYAIVTTSNTIRVSNDTFIKFYRFKRNFMLENGREPTVDELSELLGMPLYKVYIILSYLNGIISLNSLVGDDDKCEMVDFVSDDSISIEDKVINDSLKSYINELFNSAKLKPFECDYINYRFGLNGGEPLSLKEIASIYGVSHQYVDQTISRIIRKLRRNSYVRKLAVYADNCDAAISFINDYNRGVRNFNNKSNNVLGLKK